MATFLQLMNTSGVSMTAKDTNARDTFGTQEMLADVVSDEAVVIFQWISFSFICELVDIFGAITNIINIICFVKQGFKDPVNVSFLGLSVSDLGCVVTLIWTNLCLNPAFHEANVTFDTIEISYLTAGWPHVVFTRVTSCITALITLERCLCITMPLKVKTIITPRRVTVIVVSIFTILILSVLPIYYANRFGLKFFPQRNRTMLGLVYTEDRATVEEFIFTINNLLVPFVAFMTVIVSTITLVVKLKGKEKWRMKCAASVNAETMADRDRRVTKMVVMISSLFIACFTPLCITFIAMLMVPGLSIDGRYRNTLVILSGFGFLLESVNSSMNFFIYYHMSSRYRDVFRQLFTRRKN